MANPRQRRKARSSTHKKVTVHRNVRKNLKKPKPIRGPKILQDAWDKTKTVRQNYAALGLALSHNPIQSGGVERDSVIQVDNGTSISSAATATTPPQPTMSASPTSTVAAAQSAGSGIQARHRGPKLGRIVRDAQGNVIAVELPEDHDEDDDDDDGGKDQDGEEPRQRQRRQAADNNNGPDPDESLKEPELDRVDIQNWAQRTILSGTAENSVVSALESLSTTASSVVRHTSGGERNYLVALLRTYPGDDDMERASRDRRLNPMQYTPGELRRAVRKSGGRDRILAGQL